MNEHFTPITANSLCGEIPNIPSDYELLVSYADALLDLARKNYSGELKTKIHYIFTELDFMPLEEITKMSFKTVLTDIQSIMLLDESENYLERVCLKLKTLKYMLVPN